MGEELREGGRMGEKGEEGEGGIWLLFELLQSNNNQFNSYSKDIQ